MAFLLLDSWPWLDRSSELDLSVLPSGNYVGTGSLVFLELSMVLGAHVMLCMTAVFLKIIFLLQKWRNCANMSQIYGFFNWLANLVIDFSRIWLIIKFYIFCCILAQVPYLGRIFWVVEVKNGSGLLGHETLKSAASQS